MTRHACSILGMIVEALEFVQTTGFGIRATLGHSLILKHIVFVYTSSLYLNECKTIRGIHAVHFERSSKLMSLFIARVLESMPIYVAGSFQNTLLFT